jgi:2-dehydropantoate 2-reductase
MSSVAVVGVGAMGGFFGAQAAAAGNDVTLCVRTPFPRLVVETRGQRLEVAGPIVTDPSQVEPVDWVLLATKAHQTYRTAGWLHALCGPSTTVVVLQNGVQHVERVAALCPPGTTILPSVVHCGAESPEPGHVLHYTYGFLYVPDTAPGQALAELFAGSGAEIRPTDDFPTRMWEKMVSNVAVNAITALTLQRIGVLQRPGVADLAQGLMNECAAVARLEGARIDDAFVHATRERLQGLPAEAGTSMLYDRLAGRRLEHESLDGAVADLGRRRGVPTPLNDAMTALLDAISAASADPAVAQ